MATPLKHPDSGVYFFRKVVPEDVRAQLGKREFKYSLHTKDLSKAKVLFAAELGRVEALIQNARSGGPKISERKALALAGEWLKSELDQDEKLRDEGKVPAEESNFVASDEEHEVYDLELATLEDDIDSRKAAPWVTQHIQTTLERHALAVPAEGTAANSFLVNAFSNALYRYFIILKERANGTWREFDASKIYPELKANEWKPKAAPDEGRTLLQIFESWKREAGPRDKTAEEYAGSLNQFIEVTGISSAALITKVHIRTYKDFLLGNGLKPATVNKKVTALGSILSYAETNGEIETNPVAGTRIKVRHNAEGDRLPFSAQDIETIFTSPVYAEAYRPRAGGGEAAYWLPILAYYTGARVEELGQLLTEDIQSEGGIPYFEMTTLLDSGEKSDKSLKTGRSSHRIIPMHPDLIKLGFLDYVSKTKKKSKRVFPALKEGAHGSRTQNWSKWWNQRYLRESLKITHPKKVFHSFRHTFTRLGREAGIPQEMLRVMTGHSRDRKDAHTAYGGWTSPRGGSYPYSPNELWNEISKMHGICSNIIR